MLSAATVPAAGGAAWRRRHGVRMSCAPFSDRASSPPTTKLTRAAFDTAPAAATSAAAPSVPGAAPGGAAERRQDPLESGRELPRVDRHRRRLRRLLAGLALLLGGAAPSAAADLALGLRAGTHGFGPELDLALSRQVHARVAAGFLTYDTTYDDTGVRYDGELELRNALLLLDWHPGGRGFRFSAGGAWNDNRLVVTAPLRELVRAERPELLPLLPAGDLGRVHGSAAGDSFAPYAGLGWGTPPAAGRGWGVTFDLGALYHGEPEVDLGVDLAGGITLPPAGRQALDALAAEEARRLEAELADYTFLPVVAFGITYRR